MTAKFIIGLINLYQKSGGGKKLLWVDCNFTPSCSEYSKQALQRYGFAKGIILGFKRFRRCTNKDSLTKIPDPLPKKKTRDLKC